MIRCHSRIERPYFFSIDGKCEAGPCFGQGGPFLAMTLHPAAPRSTETRDRPDLFAAVSLSSRTPGDLRPSSGPAARGRVRGKRKEVHMKRFLAFAFIGLAAVLLVRAFASQRGQEWKSRIAAMRSNTDPFLEPADSPEVPVSG